LDLAPVPERNVMRLTDDDDTHKLVEMADGRYQCTVCKHVTLTLDFLVLVATAPALRVGSKLFWRASKRAVRNATVLPNNRLVHLVFMSL
jgi:hypothetical protein